VATFSEIKSYISGIISDNSFGDFYSMNVKEYGNLTQKTEADTILFLLDAPGTTSDNEFTAGNRVLRSYSLTFFILKAASDELTENQLDDIYSDMENIATQFFWHINVGNTTIFNIDSMTTERVKFITPNSFAGVTFTLRQVRTACNL